MPLPTCQCNAGQPTQTQLANIYCALLEVITNGEITFPLAPSQGGTGVANADTETFTLNGGFPLGFTLTGATNVTLPTSGVIQVFNQSLNSGDSVTFGGITLGLNGSVDASNGGSVLSGDFNGLTITNNGGGTLDIQNVAIIVSGNDYTLTGAAATIVNSDSAADPGNTFAIGVPTQVYGDPAVALLADPDRWGTMDIGGVAFRFPLYAA